MVENVADDGVKPKPAKIEASGVGVASCNVKPNGDIKFKDKILFQDHIGHNQENLNWYLPITLKKNLNLNRYLPVFVVLK